MPSPNLDSIRTTVLDRMERHERNIKLAMFGAAIAEAALIAIALLNLDFSQRFEVVVFLLFVLSYTIIAFGLFALGIHVSRVGDRVLSALESAARG